MIEVDIDVWVLFMNIFLTALVKKNMLYEAREVYNKMVLRGVSGDCVTVHGGMRACLKEGNDVEAENVFRDAMLRGVELDAAAYSIVIQAVCTKPDYNLGCKLLREAREIKGGFHLRVLL